MFHELDAPLTKAAYTMKLCHNKRVVMTNFLTDFSHFNFNEVVLFHKIFVQNVFL